jgi:hypothetical protein
VQVSSSYDWSLKCCEVLFNLIVFDALEQICWDNHPQFEIVITLDYFIKKWSNPNSLGGYLSPLSPWNEENAWKVRLCAKEETRNGCEKLSEKFRPKHKKFHMGRNMWRKGRNYIWIFSPGAKSQWLCV